MKVTAFKVVRSPYKPNEDESYELSTRQLYDEIWSMGDSITIEPVEVTLQEALENNLSFTTDTTYQNIVQMKANPNSAWTTTIPKYGSVDALRADGPEYVPSNAGASDALHRDHTGDDVCRTEVQLKSLGPKHQLVQIIQPASNDAGIRFTTTGHSTVMPTQLDEAMIGLRSGLLAESMFRQNRGAGDGVDAKDEKFYTKHLDCRGLYESFKAPGTDISHSRAQSVNLISEEQRSYGHNEVWGPRLVSGVETSELTNLLQRLDPDIWNSLESRPLDHDVGSCSNFATARYRMSIAKMGKYLMSTTHRSTNAPVVVDCIDSSTINKFMLNLLKVLRLNHWQTYDMFCRWIVTAVGATKSYRSDPTIYQAQKAGIYALLPDKRRKIKSKYNLYDYISIDRTISDPTGLQTQLSIDLTPEAMTTPECMTWWMYMLSLSDLNAINRYSDQHVPSIIRHGTDVNVSDCYKEAFKFFGIVSYDSQIKPHLSTYKGQDFVGYGNSLEKIKSLVRYNSNNNNNDLLNIQPSIVPICLLTHPVSGGKHDLAMASLAKNYFKEGQLPNDPQEIINKRMDLLRDIVIQSSGSYDVLSDTLTLSPTMTLTAFHSLTPNTRAPAEVRAALKDLYPSLKFVNNTMTFKIKASDLDESYNRVVLLQEESTSRLFIGTPAESPRNNFYSANGISILIGALSVLGTSSSASSRDRDLESRAFRLFTHYRDFDKISRGRLSLGYSESTALLGEGFSRSSNQEELKDFCRAFDLKISGTKDELVSRLSEHYGKIYESFRIRIAGIIPFDNLVILDEETRHSRNQSRERGQLSCASLGFDLGVNIDWQQFFANAYSQHPIPFSELNPSLPSTIRSYLELSTERLNTKSSAFSTEENGLLSITALSEAKDLLVSDYPDLFSFIELCRDLCGAFLIAPCEIATVFSVFIAEHTQAGAIFRKNSRDALMTPENLFYSLMSESGDSERIREWKGIEL